MNIALSMILGAVFGWWVARKMPSRPTLITVHQDRVFIWLPDDAKGLIWEMRTDQHGSTRAVKP